jgi:hypothetical protein
MVPVTVRALQGTLAKQPQRTFIGLMYRRLAVGSSIELYDYASSEIWLQTSEIQRVLADGDDHYVETQDGVYRVTYHARAA